MYVCAHALQDILLFCQAIQPVKPEKVLGPSTILPIPGILLDTVKGEARLPKDKLSALKRSSSIFITLLALKSNAQTSAVIVYRQALFCG